MFDRFSNCLARVANSAPIFYCSFSSIVSKAVFTWWPITPAILSAGRPCGRIQGLLALETGEGHPPDHRQRQPLRGHQIHGIHQGRETLIPNNHHPPFFNLLALACNAFERLSVAASPSFLRICALVLLMFVSVFPSRDISATETEGVNFPSVFHIFQFCEYRYFKLP